jgi:hypothetical protein
MGKLGGEAGGEAAGLSDPSFEVSVILLDVDDTIPKFKSVVEAEYGGCVDRRGHCQSPTP